jgi:hypothetical protein
MADPSRNDGRKGGLHCLKKQRNGKLGCGKGLVRHLDSWKITAHTWAAAALEDA